MTVIIYGAVCFPLESGSCLVHLLHRSDMILILGQATDWLISSPDLYSKCTLYAKMRKLLVRFCCRVRHYRMGPVRGSFHGPITCGLRPSPPNCSLFQLEREFPLVSWILQEK